MGKKHGFTLVEVVLILALMSIVIVVSYSVFFMGQKSFEVGIDKGLDQADNRILREYLVKEFRYIKYLDNKPPESNLYEFYYTMKIIDNKDVRQLEKTKFKDNIAIENYLISTIKFDELTLDTENGIIEINFIPLGKQKAYNYTIRSENNNNLTNIKFPEENNEIYYAYPEDNIVASSTDTEEPTEDGLDDSENEDSHLPLDHINDWNSNMKYNIGEKVRYLEKIYNSRKNNNDKTPTNSGHWELIK